MSVARYLLRRVVWTVVASLIVLTAAFLLFRFVPDPTLTLVRFFGGKEAADAYAAARNYNAPILQQYVHWMVNYLALDLGTTLGGRRVEAVLAERAPPTLVYLVPGLFLGNLLGILTGHLAAMRGGLTDAVTSTLSYLGQGVPAFFMGELAVVVFIENLLWYRMYWDDRYGLWTAENLVSLSLPALVVALNVFVVQLRYSRAETLEFASADFVRTFRASGAGFFDRSRHILRNASLPLISLFVTETLTVIFVTIYVVEVVFRVPGLGELALIALKQRDFALILATTLIPVFAGLFGTLVQDILYAFIDPRIGDGG